MRAGRMWVWLVLAAVFSMHGPQCMAADTHHADGGSVHVQALAWPEAAAPALLPIMEAHPDVIVGMAGMRPAPASQEPPASGAAHAWAACLAVVVSGLTALASLAGLGRRTTSAGWDRTLTVSRSWSARAHRLRPPDLAALCLLRI
jgi:hypothetical protein